MHMKFLMNLKNYKTLSLVSYIGIGVFGFVFLYNILYALIADVDPVIPAQGMIFALPLVVGLFLVPFGFRHENRGLIYLGQMMAIVSGAILVFQIGRLCYGLVSDIPNVAYLLTITWPLLLLATSLTLMAFYKKADFRPIHNIVVLVALGGLALSVLITLVIIIVWAVQFRNGLLVVALLPTFFVFLGLAPILLFSFVLKDEARIAKLEVPEWVKPVKPAPAPKAETPKLEPKVQEEKPFESAPIDNKEETPKA